MHSYHISIALHHIYTVFLSDRLLGLIQSVEFMVLMVDFRVRRVDVFLLHTLCTGIQQSSAESHHLTTDVQPGENHTTSITVRQGLSLIPRFLRLIILRDAQACLYQELRLITGFLGCQGQGITFRKRIAQRELLDDIVSDATATEVLPAYGNAVRVVLQHVLKIVLRPLIDNEHRLTVALFLTLLVSQFLLLNLDIVFLRQPAQGLRIGDLLVFHQEVDGCTTLTTGEALADLFRGRHHERGCRVIMERTQTFVVHARLPQRHELTHHVHNVRGIHDLVYRRPVNHNRLQRYKIKPQITHNSVFFIINL